MVLKSAAVAAALCLTMLASGLWHGVGQQPTLLFDDRDMFIKAQAAQQMQDYVNAFGDGKAAQSKSEGEKHTVLRAAATQPDMAMPAPLRAKKSSTLLNHWSAINDVVFPKKWMHAKPVHHESRKQQERQEMSHISHVNAKTIPAARKHKMRAQPTTSGAMLKHYDHLFDSTFDDTRSSVKFSNPTSQTELAHLKDLSDAVFPKEEAVSGKHWTATKQNLLAHYKQLSDDAFPSEHFSHNAPMSGDEELAQYKAESSSVNPSEKRRAHHKRVRSKEATATELAHLKDISSRVFPASKAARGSRQTARDSEAAELAGIHSLNNDVFPKLHSASHHQQTSDEELASLHKLSDSVFPALHAAKHHQRGTAQQELEAGMKMVAGREFRGKLRKIGKHHKLARGVHGVVRGSQLHAEQGPGAHPWHRKRPVNHVEVEKRNVV